VQVTGVSVILAAARLLCYGWIWKLKGGNPETGKATTEVRNGRPRWRPEMMSRTRRKREENDVGARVPGSRLGFSSLSSPDSGRRHCTSLPDDGWTGGHLGTSPSPSASGVVHRNQHGFPFRVQSGARGGSTSTRPVSSRPRWGRRRRDATQRDSPDWREWSQRGRLIN
jgi:hypothetical protein